MGGGFKEAHSVNETSLSESMSEAQLDHLPAGSELLRSACLRSVCVCTDNMMFKQLEHAATTVGTITFYSHPPTWQNRM